MSTVQSSLGHQGYELKRCGLLLALGRPLPDLPHILASHALIHAADGELFHKAALRASEHCGLEIFKVKESGLIERASHILRLKVDELGHRLVHFGTKGWFPVDARREAGGVGCVTFARWSAHPRNTSRATKSH